MTGKTFDIRFLDQTGDTIIILVTIQETQQDAINRAQAFANFRYARLQVWSGLRLLEDLSVSLVAA